MCAGNLPADKHGRPWLELRLLPLPQRPLMWPQSARADVGTGSRLRPTATTSGDFWYLGMIPDFATAATAHQQAAEDDLQPAALGLEGHRTRLEPLRARIRAVRVDLDAVVMSGAIYPCPAILAVLKVTGMAHTIFPPTYFVAGAIFGGFGMVVFLLFA